MIDLENFWHLVPSKESLSGLSLEQSQAIFRLLMIGTFADEKVTTPERLVLAQALVNLPFFKPHDWEVMEQTRGIQILANMHDRFHDPKQFPDVMREIREGLGDEPTCTLGLRMLSLLMQADDFGDDEYDFCLMIGAAMGLDTEETTVIIQDAQAQANA